jgi:hypothetical protein
MPHDVGGVLGRPLETFFWALIISWSWLFGPHMRDSVLNIVRTYLSATGWFLVRRLRAEVKCTSIEDTDRQTACRKSNKDRGREWGLLGGTLLSNRLLLNNTNNNKNHKSPSESPTCLLQFLYGFRPRIHRGRGN